MQIINVIRMWFNLYDKRLNRIWSLGYLCPKKSLIWEDLAVDGPDTGRPKSTGDIRDCAGLTPSVTSKLWQHVLGDVLVRVHDLELVQSAPEEGLEWSIDTYIQWLELGCGMRGQGNNNDTMLHCILNNMNVHVTFSIIHD